jgi:transcriptional regulator GlxA family with amidase domain
MEVVANSCGYKNANSFWSAFKQIAGASPKNYREQFLK